LEDFFQFRVDSEESQIDFLAFAFLNFSGQ